MFQPVSSGELGRMAFPPRRPHKTNPCPIHRSFLKTPGSPNIPIQAIGLSLYEKLSHDGPEEGLGQKVTRTQWLDFSSINRTDLIGKNILIVDEVDDTRTTLQYAVQELEKDVNEVAKKAGRGNEKTNFYVFVLHVSALNHILGGGELEC